MSSHVVAAIRKRRLGYVWHGAEQNQRLARQNVRASEHANGSTASAQCPIGWIESPDSTKPSSLPPSICWWAAFHD
jgi:hypothetical protein